VFYIAWNSNEHKGERKVQETEIRICLRSKKQKLESISFIGNNKAFWRISRHIVELRIWRITRDIVEPVSRIKSCRKRESQCMVQENTDEIIGLFDTEGKKRCPITKTTLVCIY
jgi:hypothetical protein